MNRIPPATLVANKTYLEPGFDAERLTMVQLRSILNHHGFEYPTSGRKIQLVQLFNEKIGAAHGQLGHGPSRKENPTVSPTSHMLTAC